MKTWRRTEPREVRPFFGVVAASTSLDGTGVRLRADAPIVEGGSIELTEADLPGLAPIVHLNVVKPQLPTGLDAGELAVIVVLRHALLKRSEAVESLPLSTVANGDWPIPPALLARFGGGRDLEIVVALVLDADRAPAPGLPSVRGQWLARKSVKLRSFATPNIFDVQPRTGDEWLERGYPERTLYAAEYAGGVLDPDAGSVATVWVHARLFERLAASGSPGPLPLLAAEMVHTILLASEEEWRDLAEAPQGSPLSRVLGRLGDDGGAMSLFRLRDMAKLEPAKLRAVLQDRTDALEAMLGGK